VNAALNVKDYACAKVRRRMDSYLAGELSVDLSHEILEHLDRCPDCSAELKARENMRAAVRRIAALAPGPRDGFEAEVRARLARVPAPRAASVRPLLLAASLFAAAGAGTLFVLSRSAGAPGTDVAAIRGAKAFLFAALNHRNCTLRFAKWATAPAPAMSELASTLDAESRAAVAKAADGLPGYTPVAAHECSHAGEKIFHVILRRSGSSSPNELVSVIATRPRSRLAEGVRLAGLVDGGRMDGLAAVGTTAPNGRLVFLVTSGSDRETMSMGRAVLPSVAAAFVAR
jgi:hypothetical protein